MLTGGGVSLWTGLLPDALIESALCAVPPGSGQGAFLHQAEGASRPNQGQGEAKPGSDGDRVLL